MGAGDKFMASLLAPPHLPPVNQEVKQITADALKAVEELYPDDEAPPPPPPTDPISEAVTSLLNKGIRMLAVDFDQTYVDCHTGGDWARGADVLCRHVRGFIPELIGEASRRGIHVCIATFSPQTDLIREVVEMSLPGEVSSKVVIKGNDRVWELPRGSEGKQGHFAAAAREFGEILMEQICLIDDDNRNIGYARRHGVFGVICPARERTDATKQVVLEGCKAGRESSPSHNITVEPRSPHRLNRPDPLSTFGGSAASPPPSPHSPYSPYPCIRSPVGLGSPSYHSPRSPMGVRSPMGGKGGFGSPRSPMGGKGGFF